MTQRDLAIISMVYDYGGCGVEHIRKLFSQGTTAWSIPCYRRIAYLVKQGYLRSLLLPALNKQFLIPGTRARGLLSQALKDASVRRIRIESPLLILHKLAICDFRVSLELASRQSPLIVLTQWVNESALRQSPLLVADPESEKQTRLIPDAGFTLFSQATGRTAQFYLEMDLGTVTLKAIRQRIRGYLLRRQTPCPVLFVVPDTKRQAAIARIAGEEAEKLTANPTSIWITTQERISFAPVLSAAWFVVGHKNPVSFAGLAGNGGQRG